MAVRNYINIGRCGRCDEVFGTGGFSCTRETARESPILIDLIDQYLDDPNSQFDKLSFDSK
jgi:hypothetical protein